MNRVIPVVLLAVVTFLPFAIAHASDEIAPNGYACVLDGSLVVPHINPYYPGWVGRIDLKLSATNELSYDMYECAELQNYEVHIHGPALNGAIGPVIFTIPPLPPDQRFRRTGVLGTLNSQQIHDLNCMLWYVDIHTAEYQYGIVRGQLRGMWTWGPGWPCYLSTQESTWGAVKAMYR
ncbi:MAG TPA: CHRD domain-containing protein [Candidatus Krumholzibacteria bacterium]|nr:CHRD domain-containing protein [Candidatus Krumholzibacteria bacterium]